MKIFAAGIATETNTFSAVHTALEDFFIQRGKDALAGRIPYPSLDLSNTWGRQARQGGHHFAFSLMARAPPSGLTVKSAYEALRDEVLRDLVAEMPVDVVLLNLHGAMIAQGYYDCEEDIIRRVRMIVGSDAVIGVELDLHCNLTESKLSLADLVITYKEYPHIDMASRARELFDLAIATKLEKIRPAIALFDCRMIGLYPTWREPMRSFVNEMIEIEKCKAVLSVSLGHGFQFADVEHLGAKTLAITDNEPALARQIAQNLGMRAYGLRHEIGCESFSLPLEQAFAKALASQQRPIVLADQSDNPGGGAPGDSTFALQWMLTHQITDAAVALIYDPEVVRIANRGGKDAVLSLRLGGKLGHWSGAPIDIDAQVTSIQCNYVHSLPQRGGDPHRVSAGDVVALRCLGIDILVSSMRCQCFSPEIFTDLGIDPRAKRLLVIKSAQHFYAAFAPIAGEIIYMSAPGAVSPDPRLIRYRHVDTRRLYPWTEDPLAV